MFSLFVSFMLLVVSGLILYNAVVRRRLFSDNRNLHRDAFEEVSRAHDRLAEMMELHRRLHRELVEMTRAREQQRQLLSHRVRFLEREAMEALERNDMSAAEAAATEIIRIREDRQTPPQPIILDEVWDAWKKHLGEATHEREQTEQLAHKLWQEAGSPEGQQDHFWDMAEQQLTKRTLGEKGVSGACMTDKELAKQKAIEQFIRRRKAAIRDGQIENSSLYAGMPMIFYCKQCGIMIETLPEDYLFSPRKQCSQCKGLAEMNWLNKAKEAAEEADLQLPTPKRWVPNEARKENSEVAQ